MTQLSTNEIITTIGPSSADVDILNKLKSAGATSFRINLSHSDDSDLLKYLTLFSKTSVLPSIDTQGAQVRIDSDPKKELYERGQTLVIKSSNAPSTLDCDFSINHPELFHQISVDDLIRIDFEGMTVKVVSIGKESWSASCLVLTSGRALRNKALDVLGKPTLLDPLTDFDKRAIIISLEHNISEIYLSFVNKASDVLQLKEFLLAQGCVNYPRIISKIESELGIINLESIIRESDAILVDRGDLSREISISKVPIATRSILSTCRLHNTPCFIATNVLDSMINLDLPSRAEISDLFHLFEQGTSGIVLAAEVAIGKNPVECVQVVRYINQIYKAQSNSLLGVISSSQLLEALPEPLRHWL